MKNMDEVLARILQVVAIFLGIVVRTLAPLLRKKTLADFFKMELTWLYTAGGAFIGSWVSILMIIPTDLPPEIQIIAGFLIAFGANSILNEAVKWKAVTDYIRTGEKPGT